MTGFIFGGNTGETAQSLQRRREIANRILQGVMDGRPKTVAGGIDAVGSAIIGRIAGHKADKGIAAGREQANSLFGDILTGSLQNEPSQGGYSPFLPQVEADPHQNRIDTAHAVAAGSDNGGDKEGFIQSIMPHALEASQRTGVDPRIIIAQSAQETGWGKHAPGNNFFGIKSHGKSGGQELATNEFINGQNTRVNDSFRQYASLGDSVSGYADFITENPRYQPMRSATGLDAQLEALGQSGYATDPNYANAVGSIAKSIQLPEQASQQPQMVQASGGITPQMIEALSNPYLSNTQRGILGSLIERQLSAGQPLDPLTQAKIGKMQAETEALKQKPTDRKVLKDASGRQRYQDTGELVFPDAGSEGPSANTKGQEALDKEFAKEYVAWNARGGFADVQKQLGQLEEVKNSLESGADNLTGPVVGNTPDIVSSLFNPKAISTRENVEEVVQRNLRLVLGAQFTEKEGERLIKRAYNPQLSEQENARRVGRLIDQIKAAAMARQSASEYFEQHQTLAGWKGRLPTLGDFSFEDEGAGGAEINGYKIEVVE